MLLERFWKIFHKIIIMRYYTGLISVLISITLIIGSIYIFDFTILFDKLIAGFIFIVAAILMVFGINSLKMFKQYKRVLRKGVKTKARVINIKRSILGIKNAPKYVLEIIYEHPLTHDLYQTFVDYTDQSKFDFKPQEDELIDIYIDPNNPNVALLA